MRNGKYFEKLENKRQMYGSESIIFELFKCLPFRVCLAVLLILTRSFSRWSSFPWLMKFNLCKFGVAIFVEGLLILELCQLITNGCKKDMQTFHSNCYNNIARMLPPAQIDFHSCFLIRLRVRTFFFKFK